jgi:LuxR family transcriptional regulator/LuxR family quorum-sensing system transcriptional regulator CciR
MRDFLAAASASDDVGKLWAAMTDYFARHGISDIALVHFPQQGVPGPAGGWAKRQGWKEWARYYFAANLMPTDPIRAHASVSSVPFRWSDVPELRPFSPEEDRHYQLLTQYYEYDGLTIPVFGPNGRNGYVVMAFPKGFTLSSRRMLEFRVVSQFAHQRACELVTFRDNASPLSRREQEVLSWMARGKSNSVIADIIGVSTNTVDTHVRRIFVKLQVRDRVSAAVIATGQGLISQE